MTKVLTTAGDVIDALGGTSKVAERLGVSPQVVVHWRKNGLPAKTRDAFHALLTIHGLTAPGSLWKQMELPSAKGEAA